MSSQNPLNLRDLLKLSTVDPFAVAADLAVNAPGYLANTVYKPVKEAVENFGPLMGGEAGVQGPIEKAALETLPSWTSKLTSLLSGKKAVPGADITAPTATYQEGASSKLRGQPEGNNNIWVRQGKGTANKDRTLMVQFSSDLLQPPAEKGSDVATDYYNQLYAKRKGYARPDDFWEIPQWQAELAHNVPNTDQYTIRDPKEAAEFFKRAGYKNIAFSALDVNKPFIKKLADEYPGKIVVGGYGDLGKDFAGHPNVEIQPSMKDFVEKEMGPGSYKQGYDYRHFSGTPTVPRLQLSDGCTQKCAFCTVPKKITESSRDTIIQQADAIAKDLPSNLIYINDKTYGQAENHTMLPELFERIKKKNPNFEGFVIQTTAAQMKKFSPEFLKKAGIKYVELGIETYNDPILKELKKPATEALIDAAAEKLRAAGIPMIPNIIVGFPGETEQTYSHTLDWLKKNEDIISHTNIYNVAAYEGTELAGKLQAAGKLPGGAGGDVSENAIKKSWMEDPDSHIDFHGRVHDFALGQLKKSPTFKKATQALGSVVTEPLVGMGALLNPPVK